MHSVRTVYIPYSAGKATLEGMYRAIYAHERTVYVTSR